MTSEGLDKKLVEGELPIVWEIWADDAQVGAVFRVMQSRYYWLLDYSEPMNTNEVFSCFEGVENYAKDKWAAPTLLPTNWYVLSGGAPVGLIMTSKSNYEVYDFVGDILDLLKTFDDYSEACAYALRNCSKPRQRSQVTTKPSDPVPGSNIRMVLARIEERQDELASSIDEISTAVGDVLEKLDTIIYGDDSVLQQHTSLLNEILYNIGEPPESPSRTFVTSVEVSKQMENNPIFTDAVRALTIEFQRKGPIEPLKNTHVVKINIPERGYFVGEFTPTSILVESPDKDKAVRVGADILICNVRAL